MILQRLKTETATQHQQLERRLGLPDSVKNMLEYKQLLADFLGIYQPLEAVLFAHPEWQNLDKDWQDRRKVSALHADLTTLGMPSSQIEQVPQCSFVPELSTFCHVLGSMYVLEGATLGGQIIARHLKTILHVSPAQGCSFFSSYGATLGVQWRTFGDLLIEYASDDDRETSMVQAAQATFVTFDRWFAQQGYHND